MEKQTDFRIRSYGRTELAQLYNPCLTPKAAYRKLVGYRNFCTFWKERI